MRKTLLILIILSALFLQNAEAGGIGLRSDSLSVSIEFKPYFEETYHYSLVTYGSEPRDVQVYVEDESADGTSTNMAQYFTVSEPILRNVNSRTEPYFSITVRLPAEIKEPGMHKIHVGAIEKPLGDSGGVSIRTAIEALFYVYVPYEGQYLDYELTARSVNQGVPLQTTISVSNFGTDLIKSLYAIINLFDLQGNLIATTRTNSISLESRRHDLISANISTANILPGNYIVNASIFYDDKQAFDGREVKVGELTFKIINVTDVFVAEKINEFEVEVESQWADPIDSVYAELTIADKERIRTLPLEVAGFQKERLKGFIDMKGVKTGTHDALVKLYFGGKDISKTENVHVVERSLLELPVFELSLTNMLLLVIIMIILIINITLFVILKKKKEAYEKTQ
jgi:hypothetical protein